MVWPTLGSRTAKEQEQNYKARSTYDEVGEGRMIERQLGDAAALAVCVQFGRAVAGAHAHSLRQDLLQLRRCAARDEGPYQRQRVVVEIRLQANTPADRSRQLPASRGNNHKQLLRLLLLLPLLRGVVVSGVRRMNEVNARRARLVLGWVTVFGRV